jgi:hypothetical protein
MIPASENQWNCLPIAWWMAIRQRIHALEKAGGEPWGFLH